VGGKGREKNEEKRKGEEGKGGDGKGVGEERGGKDGEGGSRVGPQAKAPPKLKLGPSRTIFLAPALGLRGR